MKRAARAVRKPTAAVAAVAVVAAVAFVAGSRLGARAEGAASLAAVSTAPDPCALVTQAEAEQALGHSAVVTEGGGSCSYTVTDLQDFASLAVAPGPEGIDPERLHEAMQAYAEIANAEILPASAGDEAWATLTDQASQVIARSGDRLVTIIFLNVQTPADQRVQAMSDLAQLALSRMA